MKYTTYITIETDDGKYKLSALYFHKKDNYAIPSLILPNGESWDNSKYLIEYVYPFLQGGKFEDSIYYTEDVVSIVEELKKDIPKEYRKELKGIFKKAIKMGMFNNDKEL